MIRPTSGCAGPRAAAYRSRGRAGPAAVGSASVSASTTSRHVGRRPSIDDWRRPASPTLATTVRAVRHAAAATPRTRRCTAACVGEDVRVVPLGTREHGDVRPVGVEVAGVLVGLDDERGSPARSAPSPAAPPVIARGQQRADERRRIEARLARARAPASRRSCSCRASRRRRRACRPTAASATTCCHGSSGMPRSRSRRAAPGGPGRSRSGPS